MLVDSLAAWVHWVDGVVGVVVGLAAGLAAGLAVGLLQFPRPAT